MSSRPPSKEKFSTMVTNELGYQPGDLFGHPATGTVVELVKLQDVIGPVGERPPRESFAFRDENGNEIVDVNGNVVFATGPRQMKKVIEEYWRMRHRTLTGTISSEWRDWTIRRPSQGPQEYDLTAFRAAWIQKKTEVEQGITAPVQSASAPVQSASAPVQGVAALFQHIAVPIQSASAPVQNFAAAAPAPLQQQSSSTALPDFALSNSLPANDEPEASSVDFDMQLDLNEPYNAPQVDYDAHYQHQAVHQSAARTTETLHNMMIDPQLLNFDHTQTLPTAADQSFANSNSIANTQAAYEADYHRQELDQSIPPQDIWSTTGNEPQFANFNPMQHSPFPAQSANSFLTNPFVHNQPTASQIGFSPSPSFGSHQQHPQFNPTAAFQTANDYGAEPAISFQTTPNAQNWNYGYGQSSLMNPVYHTTFATQGSYNQIDPDPLSHAYASTGNSYLQDPNLLQEPQQDAEDDQIHSQYPDL